MRAALAFLDRRSAEIVLMTGFVLIALPFAGGYPGPETAGRIALLCLATFFLYLSAYSINSYCGYAADRLNPRLPSSAARSRYLLSAFAGGAASLALLLLLGLGQAALGGLCLLSAVLYSHPKGVKGVPGLGTLVHFISQTLLFHVGFLSFAAGSWRSLAIAFFFSLLFSGGHLVHELKDYDSDRAAGIRTGAVAFGPARIVNLYRALTAATFLYWGGLRLLGVISGAQFYPFGAALLIHLGLSWTLAVKRYLEPDWNMAYQRFYRLLYLIAGILLFWRPN